MSNADPTITTQKQETAADLAKNDEIRRMVRSYEIMWNKANFG